jgi:hypothetical protein
LNCFVIMPFDREFSDVYESIKTSVKNALVNQNVNCFRLDENRPAGRITDRLLMEVQAATFCVADLSGNVPNVMWELGYAMALGKPIIIVTQQLAALPFDLKDMQSLEYRRNHLSDSLDLPLRNIVIDTIQAQISAGRLGATSEARDRDKLVGDLLEDVRSLKSMIGALDRAWNSGKQQAHSGEEIIEKSSDLRGAWLNHESGTHLYAKMIGNDLLMPYCYRGNGELTGIYHGWKRAGDYWFARFSWLAHKGSGFAFLKQESLDILSGAWWHEDQVDLASEVPISGSGVLVRWERQRNAKFPRWATRALKDVQLNGIEGLKSKDIDSGALGAD